jgi:hypothetical protein
LTAGASGNCRNVLDFASPAAGCWKKRAISNNGFSGTSMTGFWYSLGLCVVLLVPEPATFALLVFAAACLVLSPLFPREPRSVPEKQAESA